MNRNSEPLRNPASPLAMRIFSGLFGAFLGLTLLKFGNPVIMEKYFEFPQNFFEWLFNSWPQVIGYWLLFAVTIAGLWIARFQTKVPKMLLVLPLVWWVWQMIAASQSQMPLARATVIHFGAGVVCFYLGVFALGRMEKPSWFWIGLLAGFAIVIGSGFQQQFGGLAETRKYWLTYIYPTASNVPPGFMKKMMSSRIFGTLFYPNTLAGVILLLLPVSLAVIWSMRQRFTPGARSFLLTGFSGSALACLYWSGSKGGWLIMLVIALVAGMWLPLKRQTKLILAVAVVALGLLGFFIKYFVFFEKGATSVTARFDYWQAAIQTAKDHPLFGTGPGTFGKAYEKLKRPESEMAQLVHNDYLQQASDSGIPGFLTYAAFVIGALAYALKKGGLRNNWFRLAVWLGLLGWAIQSLTEFGLYIPAVGWTAFALTGWLLARCGNQIDSSHAAR